MRSSTVRRRLASMSVTSMSRLYTSTMSSNEVRRGASAIVISDRVRIFAPPASPPPTLPHWLRREDCNAVAAHRTDPELRSNLNSDGAGSEGVVVRVPNQLLGLE